MRQVLSCSSELNSCFTVISVAAALASALMPPLWELAVTSNMPTVSVRPLAWKDAHAQTEMSWTSSATVYLSVTAHATMNTALKTRLNSPARAPPGAARNGKNSSRSVHRLKNTMNDKKGFVYELVFLLFFVFWCVFFILFFFFYNKERNGNKFVTVDKAKAL